MDGHHHLPSNTVAVDHREEVVRVGNGIGQKGSQLALVDAPRLRPQKLTHTDQPALRQGNEVDWIGVSILCHQSLSGHIKQGNDITNWGLIT